MPAGRSGASMAVVFMITLQGTRADRDPTVRERETTRDSKTGSGLWLTVWEHSQKQGLADAFERQFRISTAWNFGCTSPLPLWLKPALACDQGWRLLPVIQRSESGSIPTMWRCRQSEDTQDRVAMEHGVQLMARMERCQGGDLLAEIRRVLRSGEFQALCPAEARKEERGKLCNIMLGMQPTPAHELKSDDRDELKAALTEGSTPGGGNPILLTAPIALM